MNKFTNMFAVARPADISDIIIQDGVEVFGATGYPDQIRKFIRLPEGVICRTRANNRRILIIGHGIDKDVSVVAEHHNKEGLVVAVLNMDVAAFLLQNSVVIKDDAQLDELLGFRWAMMEDKKLLRKRLAAFVTEMGSVPDPTVRHWVSRYLPECYEQFEKEFIELSERNRF